MKPVFEALGPTGFTIDSRIQRTLTVMASNDFQSNIKYGFALAEKMRQNELLEAASSDLRTQNEALLYRLSEMQLTIK